MKFLHSTVFAAVFCLALSVFAEVDSVTVYPRTALNSTEISPGNLDQPQSGHGDKKEADFVLAEVSKLLENNPKSQVAELSIDPDYVSKEDTYLVNVVMEAHEQKLLLGVLITLHPTVNGWKTTIGFID